MDYLRGLYDYGFYLQRVVSGSDRPLFFSCGFGDADLEALDEHYADVIARLRGGSAPKELLSPLDVTWSSEDYELKERGAREAGCGGGCRKRPRGES